MILFQILWCVRMRGGIFYGQAVIAGLTALAHLILALYVLVTWKRKRWCDPWFMCSSVGDWEQPNPSVYHYHDHCREKTWFAIAFVCALLWAVATFCTVWFVESGRYDKWEKKWVPSSSCDTPAEDEEEVELGAMPSHGGEDAMVASLSAVGSSTPVETTTSPSNRDHGAEEDIMVAINAAVLETVEKEGPIAVVASPPLSNASEETLVAGVAISDHHLQIEGVILDEDGRGDERISSENKKKKKKKKKKRRKSSSSRHSK